MFAADSTGPFSVITVPFGASDNQFRIDSNDDPFSTRDNGWAGTTTNTTHRSRSSLDGRIDRLYKLSYRISFRVLGVSLYAAQVAADVVRTIAHDSRFSISEASTVKLTYELLSRHCDRMLAMPDASSRQYHAQRVRVWRDVCRWDPTSAQVLMFRHLGVRSTEYAADSLGVDHQHARFVCSTWDPQDLTPFEPSLLADLDSFISVSGRSELDKGGIRDLMSHLDDPHLPSVVHAIEELLTPPLG